MLVNSEAGRHYLAANNLSKKMGVATHILWSTGGLFVPNDEYAGFLARGKAMVAGDQNVAPTMVPADR
jgi:D-serine dehydratase